MSKIRCLILDDELPGLTYLRMLCEQLSYVDVVKCFDSSQEFIEESRNIDFDVCLLDINMPGVNGLEVAKALKDKYIIFVSAFPEFAVNAFELDAVDFIKKPVVRDRLEKALAKASKRILENPSEIDYFKWNTNLGKSIVFFDDIFYVSTSEVDKRDKVAYMVGGRTLLLKNITLEKLMSFLPSISFMQINKSEIVSKKAVQAHSANEIILKAPDQKPPVITLGEAYRKAFLDWLSE
jgi:two-component system, LytTR family, response regulator